MDPNCILIICKVESVDTERMAVANVRAVSGGVGATPLKFFYIWKFVKVLGKRQLNESFGVCDYSRKFFCMILMFK